MSKKLSLGDLTLDYLRNADVCEYIEDTVVCPECGALFDPSMCTEYDVTEYGVEPYSTFDEPYNERTVKYTVNKTTCPYCDYEADEDEFAEADTDDLISAPNAKEYVPDIDKLDDDLEESKKEEKIRYDKRLVKQEKLLFRSNNDLREVILADNGRVNLYNENKLEKSINFSKKGINELCEGLVHTGYKFVESVDEKLLEQDKELLKRVSRITTSFSTLENLPHIDKNLYNIILKLIKDNYMKGASKEEVSDALVSELNLSKTIADSYVEEFFNNVEKFMNVIKEESIVKSSTGEEIDTNKEKENIEKANKELDDIQKAKEELEDKVDTMLSETEEVVNEPKPFPVSEYTDKVLTPLEIYEFKAQDNLTQEQLTWLQEQNIALEELEQALKQFAEFISVGENIPFISISEYIQEIF